MKWGLVVFVVVFEVVWVVGLKYVDLVLIWSGIVVGIIVSFYFLMKVINSLFVGIVYVVFIGFGMVGIVLSEIILFYELVGWLKFLLIGVFLVGVIGLKFVI